MKKRKLVSEARNPSEVKCLAGVRRPLIVLFFFGSIPIGDFWEMGGVNLGVEWGFEQFNPIFISYS
jgi:hypothetical protein